MKIRPMGAELFHEGRQTERNGETNSRFSQFCEKRLKMKSMPKMTGFFCVFQYVKEKVPYCSTVRRKCFVSNGGSDRKAGKAIQTLY
jgi:hypothetical protein